ncbi:MAG TPA: SDR family NAD(P)-dependent oxidoreductase, partial [Alphaproteobacteria bacterium]|nr:SDR family NAD(P)-dependent oxidoreductase [Alphaproteobacteria bacterium]
MVAAFRGEGEHAGASSKQAVAAAVVGNVLEWYDFSVYAFVATTIAKQFFPAGDVAALLNTFLVYGIGFLARPLGGIVIGRYGDVRGRIVSISSLNAYSGGVTSAVSKFAYAAAKAGILGMTRALAKELGPSVAVNAICPGV